jgi:RNA polymerase sigma-70 factor (ECF subfamily)
MSIGDLVDIDRRGQFDARYLAFLETIAQLRPKLHRYCTRMTGSVLDGEDIVQDALFQAYRKLDTFDERRPLSPWLFRIAHNRCIDVLRRRELQRDAEAGAAAPEAVEPVEPPGPALGRAVEQLVLTLPPMERACVLLKDVFDYSLEEIADLVDSTVGGVKAALNRGRAKLSAGPARTPPSPAPPTSRRKYPSAETQHVLRLYIERFNRRDWDGLRELIAADAKLRVADCFDGKLVDSPYFGEYERWRESWRLALGEVEGESAIIILRLGDSGDWIPVAPISIEFDNAGLDGAGGETGRAPGRITRIADYVKCSWVLDTAAHVRVEDLSGRS